ncbi:MAG: NAD(P)/FAD-dependent oxidoreductase [Firmicutes bacterium]|nr:NAD(P)/FAD-dependent oxidoreductase [Bacillota bacterium]
MTKILVIGGGSAGIMTAARLRNELTPEEAEITIVEPSDYHIYQPAFTLVVFGVESPEKIKRPIEEVIPQGCSLVKDELASLNTDENYIETKSGQRLDYDYLILATGARPVLDDIVGLEENLGKNGIHDFYTFEGALRLREAIEKFEGGNFVVVQPPMPFKCPGAPIKMALMADDYFRRKGIRDKVNITVTSTLASVFTREPYKSKFDQIFAERGLNAVPKFNPGIIDVERKVIKAWEGTEVPYDIAVVIPPNEGQTVYEDSDIADASNFIRADKHLLVSDSHDNIYPVGDASGIPASKTASGAKKQAEVITFNLIAKIKGEETAASYSGLVSCPILTGFGKAIFAEFDYEQSLSPAQESSSSWTFMTQGMMPIYWDYMLTGKI